MAQIAALVLAGGMASRMGGGDKPLLCVGGSPMLARVIAVLQAEADCLAISANGDRTRFGRFGWPVLPDGPFAGQGPLAGLLAGLDWAAAERAELLLSAPGDTPFLPRGLVRRLAPAPAYAASGGRDHPLVAVWPVHCRAKLHAMLSTPGGRSVAKFAAIIGARRVLFSTSNASDFLNVNTPDELATARRLASEGGS